LPIIQTGSGPNKSTSIPSSIACRVHLPFDWLSLALEREVEDLEALIEAAGGSAFVFGMSSGAVLALDAAARGLAITKLALYEPPFNNPGIWGLLDDNVRSTAENYTEQLTALLAEGRRGDAVALAMTAFGAPAEAVAGMRETPVWSMFE
jgi:pimeloyl-ACP methyl ester carboxylesterase